jgi:hypothetical protein
MRQEIWVSLILKRRRIKNIARKPCKLTVPIEGKPLTQKARRIAWKNTTLSIQKGSYSEVYGYGRRIIVCDTSCRLNFGVHRLHPGGNRGDLLGTGPGYGKRAVGNDTELRNWVRSVFANDVCYDQNRYEPDDTYVSIVSEGYTIMC